MSGLDWRAAGRRGTCAVRWTSGGGRIDGRTMRLLAGPGRSWPQCALPARPARPAPVRQLLGPAPGRRQFSQSSGGGCCSHRQKAARDRQQQRHISAAICASEHFEPAAAVAQQAAEAAEAEGGRRANFLAEFSHSFARSFAFQRKRRK